MSLVFTLGLGVDRVAAPLWRQRFSKFAIGRSTLLYATSLFIGDKGMLHYVGKHWIAIAIGFSILSTEGMAGPGTVVIQEDFEDGTANNFTEVGGSDPRTGITTGDSFPVGNKAYTIYYPSDESSGYLSRYPQAFEAIEISFAQKLPDGLPIHNSGRGWASFKQSRLYDYQGVGGSNLYHDLKYYRPGFFEAGSPALWQFQLHVEHSDREFSLPITADLKKWHTQRYWLRMNSPGKRDAQLKYWFNGELRLDVKDISVSPDVLSRPNGFWVGGNFSYGGGRPDFAFRRLIDDVRIVINGDAPGATGELKVSPIANHSINEDLSTSVIPFTVTRDGAALGQVRITATSTNPSLIPNNGVIVSGTGSNWTIKATPVANRSGSASIRIVADDGMGTAAATFEIMVKAVADTPNITGTIVGRNQLSWFGLVVRRNVNDGPEVTHFKITDIKNGTLYHKDGRTMITNGQFITSAQGLAGLRFRPATGFTGTTTFQVRAATSAAEARVGGSAAQAQVLVSR